MDTRHFYIISRQEKGVERPKDHAYVIRDDTLLFTDPWKGETLANNQTYSIGLKVLVPITTNPTGRLLILKQPEPSPSRGTR
jgi:hypothetical protein